MSSGLACRVVGLLIPSISKEYNAFVLSVEESLKMIKIQTFKTSGISNPTSERNNPEDEFHIFHSEHYN